MKKLAFYCQNPDKYFLELTQKGVTFTYELDESRMLDGLYKNFIVSGPDGNWIQILGPRQEVAAGKADATKDPAENGP